MVSLLTDKQILEHNYHVDALMCSHERCGRMWTSSVLTEYMISVFGMPTLLELGLGDDGDKSRLLTAWIQHQKDIPNRSPLVLATHYMMNEEFIKLSGDRKIILLVRDLRDMAVSWFYKKIAWEGSLDMSFSDFIRNSQFGLPRVCQYYNLAVTHIGYRDHIIVKYENLKHDSMNQFAKILQFINLTVNLEILKKSLTESTLEKGRKIFIESRPKAGKGLKPEQTPFRKGEIGDYMNQFDKTDLAWFYQYVESNCTQACQEFLFNYKLL